MVDSKPYDNRQFQSIMVGKKKAVKLERMGFNRNKRLSQSTMPKADINQQ